MDSSTISTSIAAIALIVSIASAIYSYQTMMLQNKPHIRAWIESNNSVYSLFLENKGNGPAIVESLEFDNPDNKYLTKINNILDYYSRRKVLTINTKFKTQSILSKDEKLLLLSISTLDMIRADVDRSQTDINKVKFILVYKTLNDKSYVFKHGR